MTAAERVRVERGDITRVDVDAIVNAANEALIPGGGVDGAVHRAAGRELFQACRAIPEVRPRVRCPTGEVRLTPGFGLLARHVIHAVAPVWRNGRSGEPSALRACYRNAMAVAAKEGFRSVAFPALGCGAFGTPIDEGTAIAVTEVVRALERKTSVAFVVLVAFEADVERGFLKALDAARSG